MRISLGIKRFVTSIVWRDQGVHTGGGGLRRAGMGGGVLCLEMGGGLCRGTIRDSGQLIWGLTWEAALVWGCDTALLYPGSPLFSTTGDTLQLLSTIWWDALLSGDNLKIQSWVLWYVHFETWWILFFASYIVWCWIWPVISDTCGDHTLLILTTQHWLRGLDHNLLQLRISNPDNQKNY